MSETQINTKVNAKIDRHFRKTVEQNHLSIKDGLTASMLNFIKKYRK